MTVNRQDIIEHLAEKYSICWYKFDEGAGSIIRDCKNSYAGTISGATWVVNEGLYFDGVNDSVLLNTRLTPIGAMSIYMRLKAFKPSSWGEIIGGTQATSSTNGIQFCLSSTGLFVDFYHNAWNACFPRVTVPYTTFNICDGNFHDVLFTWDGKVGNNNVKLYIDDFSKPKAVSNGKLARQWTGMNARLGQWNSGGNANPFKGNIANLIVFDMDISTMINDKNFIYQNKSFVLHENKHKKFIPNPNYLVERNLVPTMTSNTEPEGLAFSKSVYSNTQAYFVFVDDAREGHSAKSGTYAENEYIGYQFSIPRKITKVTIRTRNNSYASSDAPMIFRVQASDDMTNWTTLAEFASINNWGIFETKTFSFKNDQRYLAYRIYNVRTVNRNYFVLTKLEFIGMDEEISSPVWEEFTDDLGLISTHGEDNLSKELSNTLLEFNLSVASKISNVHYYDINLKTYKDIRTARFDTKEVK